MWALVVPLVGVQLLMAIPGAFVLEQLGAVLALEGQVLGVALQEERERGRCTIRAAVQRAEREGK